MCLYITTPWRIIFLNYWAFCLYEVFCQQNTLDKIHFRVWKFLGEKNAPNACRSRCNNTNESRFSTHTILYDLRFTWCHKQNLSLLFWFLYIGFFLKIRGRIKFSLCSQVNLNFARAVILCCARLFSILGRLWYKI